MAVEVFLADVTSINQTWVAPAGVTKIKVQVWGPGGGGGSASYVGGGGGGGYTEIIDLNVNSSQTWVLSVPTGGVANGTTCSFFLQGSAATAGVFARGGGSTSTTNGGLGATAGGIGTNITGTGYGSVATRTGGRGANATATLFGGGGGGAATPFANGLNTSVTQQAGRTSSGGGTGSTGYGIPGGDDVDGGGGGYGGGTGSNNHTRGGNPGAGAGGSGFNTSSMTGVRSGPGQIIISYDDPVITTYDTTQMFAIF